MSRYLRLAGAIAAVFYCVATLCASTVTSISRLSPGPVAVDGSAVVFQVTFDSSVTGVTTSAFSLATTGTASGTMASVAGSGSVYDVTVSGLAGYGMIRLNLLGGSAISGSPAAFAQGQDYFAAATSVPMGWGLGNSGQLGDGVFANRSVPAAGVTSGALAGKTIVATAAGPTQSLGVTSDGTAYAWGADDAGQLGDGTNSSTAVAVPVSTAGVLAGKTIIAVATGNANSLALASDGTAYAWGGNSTGQLGNGTNSGSSTPVAVTTGGVLAGKTIVAIAEGDSHCLALAGDGTVYGWGANGAGQLGNNSTTSSNVPVAVSTSGVLAGKTIVAISAGGDHSMALGSDGTVYTWGFNSSGQLGNNSTTSTQVPIIVPATGVLAGKTIIAVAAGGSHSLVLASDGTVYGWGHDGFGQLGNNNASNSSVPVAVFTGGALAGKTIVEIAAGSAHSLMLASDGTAYGCGIDSSGQLGDGGSAQSNVPIPVATGASSALPSSAMVCDLELQEGSNQSLALVQVPAPTLSSVSPAAGSSNGGTSVTIIGTNFSGASTVSFGANAAATVTLVSSTSLIASAPAGSLGTVDITVGTIGGTTAISAADQYTYTPPPVAVTSIFGLTPGQTISGGNAVFQATFNQNVTGVTAAAFSLSTTGTAAGTIASVTGSGGVYDVTVNGLSGYGMIRLNLLGGSAVSGSPAAFTSGPSYLVAPASVPVDWGLNTSGQLGNNSTTTSSIPVDVLTSGALAGKTIVAVTEGGNHSLALASDGTVYAWGLNTNGQLGNNSTTNSSVPVAVSPTGVLAGKTIVAIAAGSSYSLALASDGTVYTWGQNDVGQLGNNSTSDSSVPVAVSTAGVLAGKTLVAIAAGANHCLALASDGTVYAWGIGGSGQLGDNASTSIIPVAVQMSTVLQGKTVVAIAAGQNHSLALTSDGMVSAWGQGDSGQLGNGGNAINNLTPVMVVASGALAGKKMVAVAGGFNHSLAVAGDGTVYAWGLNSSGQLGNNSTTNSNVPVAVSAGGFLAGKAIVAVAGGENHSLALASDGTCAIWGADGDGQLGNNSTANILVPIAAGSAAVPTGVLFCGLGAEEAANHSLVLISATAPTVSSISVATGSVSGGASLTITGTGFSATSTVFFGATPASSVTVISGTSLVVIAPQGTVGAVDITVATIAGTSAAGAADQFTYTPAPVTVTSISGLTPGKVVTGGSATFQVTFSQSVTGVAASAFSLSATATAAGTIASVTGSGGVYDVTVSGLSGYGLIRLNLLGGSAISGSPAAFTSGQGYMVAAATKPVAWGLGTTDELGNGANTNSDVPVAVTASGVLSGKTVAAVAAGGTFSLALASDGTVYAWGANKAGLGTGATGSSNVPVAVLATGVLHGKTIVAIAAGTNHGVALSSDGIVFVWGNGASGQLGNNTTTSSTSPVAVSTSGVLAGKTIVAIAAGVSHTLALASDGTVYAWGLNFSGQLGNNTNTNSSVPVAVSTLLGKTIVAIAAGGNDSLALASDGTIFAWGSDSNGQLGNNATTNSSVPVVVSASGALSGKAIVAIAAGGTHSLALASDGTVYAWGLNASGQLGDNGTTDSSVPGAVTTSGALLGKTIVAIAAGIASSVALANDGAAYGWGSNASGQLGNGSTTNSSVPVIVSTGGTSAVPVGALFSSLEMEEGGSQCLGLYETISGAAQPSVTGVSPASGPPGGGTSVAIAGANLSGATAVKFGSTAATSFTVNSATSITAVAPVGSAGVVDITVTTPGGTSATGSADQFTYAVALPTVSGISPATGPAAGGTSVTITGANLTGATAVSFGATTASTFTVNSATSIIAAAPAGIAGVEDITVTTAGGTSGTSAADQFTYAALPAVATVSVNGPAAGGGTSVTIAGSNLTGTTAVNFGTTPATSFTVNGPTSITAVVPAGTSATADVSVQTPGGASAPSVNSISPGTGPTIGGAAVTITGTNLSGATAVSFGAIAAASFTINSANSITAIAPAGLVGVGDITVTTSGGTSATGAADQFTYLILPTVTAVSVNGSAPGGGTSVSITGTNLTGATAVFFGTTPATSFTVTDSGSITAVAPAGTPATANVTVQTASGTSGPAVTAVSSGAGPTAGGTVITITGTNLTGASAVSFDGTPAASFTVNSSTSITAVAPAGSAGTGDITVTTPGGASAPNAADQFTSVTPPAVTNVAVNGSAPDGGTSVTLSGSNFTGATAVYFGTTPATSFTVSSSGSIAAVAPTGTSPTANVSVQTAGGTLAPAVTSISTAAGPVAGTTSVTITGTNLTGASAVRFGSTEATSFTVNSPTSIAATVPAGLAGAADITVTTAGGPSATSSADQFTYDARPTVSEVAVNGPAVGGGTAVTITGSNFTGTTAVDFGTTPATSFTVNSPTSITAVVPAGIPATASVSVQTPGGASAPSVTSISPNMGPTVGGTAVTIIGTNLSGASAVSFGSTAATSFAVNSATSITATAPAGPAGAVDITVTTAGGPSATSLADQFTYVVLPTVTGVSADGAAPGGGTSVTVTGTNFTGATAVFFGTTPATSFTVTDSGSITAVAPAGTPATVNVTVQTSSGTSGPAVTSVSPSTGPTAGGTLVAITGTNLTGASAVYFGATAAASFTVNSSTSLTAVAPAGLAETVDITIITAGGTSATGTADQFTSVTPPTVTNVSVNGSAPGGGTSVTISGSNFTDATAVYFGTTPATSFTVSSSGSITAVAPPGTSPTANVSVQTAGGTLAPAVTSISTAAGPVAGTTSVTITGTNLTGASAVDFGATPATSFTVNSPTSITAIVPADSAGAADITVTTAGGSSVASSADQFTFVPPPTVSDVAVSGPAAGGGTAVTITGNNFTGTTGVFFGTTPATSFTVNSSGSITAVAPAGTPATVNVSVQTAGGTSAPTVTAISPSTGPTVGGTAVTITGTNLTGATAVRFGSTAATGFTVDGATSITAIAPAGSAGVADITVTTPGGTSVTSSADQFTSVVLPTVTDISANGSAPGGGTSVTITGTNFTAATAVYFGTTPATSFTVNSSGSITAIAPVGTPATMNVTVQTPGGTSGPAVTSVSPNAGPTVGGTSVVITGTNLTGATAVAFGSTPATSFTVNNSTSITATAPAGLAETVDITIATAGGTSATGTADEFTSVTPPAVTNVAVNGSAPGGGTSVTISGSNFTDATAVYFGTTPATSFTVSSSGSITAVAPSGTSPTANVSVQTPGGTLAPAVTSISPASGSSSGSTSVTITGTNLTGASAVRFGSTAVTSFTVNSPTSLTVSAPSETAGSVDITVVTAGGTSPTGAADQFTYVTPPVFSSGATAAGVYNTAYAGTALYQAVASNSPTYAVTSGTLPTGLSLDPATGDLAGTPTQSGAFPVTITATNAGGSADLSLGIQINKAIATIALGSLNPTYDTTTKAATAMTVPNGLTVNFLYGSPGSATAPAAAGTYPVTAMINDANYLGSASGSLVIGKATATVTLGSLAPTYDGTGKSATATTNPSGLTVTYTYNNSATVPIVAGTYAVVGTISDPNYQGSGRGNLVIAKATAPVVLSNLSQVYDGTGRTAGATTTPTGLTVAFTYGGFSTAPINVGSYPVAATINDANYQGSASGSLAIASAPQTIFFPQPLPGQVGAAGALGASASSGLAITYTVTGNATLVGNTVVPGDTNPVSITASQSGNANYLAAASVTRTITASAPPAPPALTAQTITVGPLPANSTTAKAFTLAPTASSNLPVTVTYQSGPVTVSGYTVIPTGAAGTAVLVLSQAGNSQYAAASAVTISVPINLVGVRQFFGTFTVAVSSSVGPGLHPQATLTGTLAATIDAASTSGTLIGTVGGSAFVVNLTIAANGSFTGSTTAITVSDSTVTGPLNFSGTLTATTLAGTISPLGASFSVTADPITGASAGIAGYYAGSSLQSSAGTTYSIVGTQGEVLVISVSPTLVTSGVGAVNANDTFTVTTAQSATITGSVNPTTTTVTGTVTTPTGGTTPFSGLASTTPRTDRLINLSSRGTVSGSNLLVSGLVIGGSANKTVLLRAVGPGLASFGITGFLAQPRLQLFDSTGKLMSDLTAWGGSAALSSVFSRTGAFPLAATSADAAFSVSLPPGQYTVQVSNAATDAGGIALAEIYDASSNPAAEDQRLINISTRAFVTGGAANLTGGFIVTGNSPETVLVRGIGPGLAGFGIANALSDPFLTVYDSTGAIIAQNDNWSTPLAVSATQVSASAADITAADLATGAFPLATGSKDAALLVTLAPGAYTAQVSGVGGAAGTALVEIYEVPSQ